VTSLSFSGDGTTLASTAGAVIKVWDRSELLSKEQKARPRADAEAEALVSQIRFSPDGRYLLSANQDGTAQMWEVGRGGELFTLRGHTDALRMAEFSPEGDFVVTSSEDGNARLWSVDTGKELGTYTVPVKAVGFSQDNEYLITGGAYHGVTIWDAESGERVRTLRLSSKVFPLITATFTPDGDRVVAADEFGWVGMWDADSGEKTAPIKNHLLPFRLQRKNVKVTDAELSSVPGEYRLLALYDDGSARLWDIDDLVDGGNKIEVVRTFGGTEDPLTEALFTGDGDVITVGGSDQTARLWDPESESPDPLWSGSIGEVGIVSTAVSPDGNLIAIGGADRGVRLWDVETGVQAGKPLRGGSGTPLDVAFSADGEWILAGGSDGTTTIWDAGTGDLLAILRMHSDGVGSVAASLGKIVSGSEDHSAKMYSCETCVPTEDLERFAEDRLNPRVPRT
jgi:WD40 repeat protein